MYSYLFPREYVEDIIKFVKKHKFFKGIVNYELNVDKYSDMIKDVYNIENKDEIENLTDLIKTVEFILLDSLFITIVNYGFEKKTDLTGIENLKNEVEERLTDSFMSTMVEVDFDMLGTLFLFVKYNEGSIIKSIFKENIINGREEIFSDIVTESLIINATEESRLIQLLLVGPPNWS